MNAVRFRRRLNAPIAEFPELTPMVGKDVEIIALEEANSQTESEIEEALSAIEKHDAEHGGPPPLANFDDLKGGWPEEERNDGFEEAVDALRRQPWTPKAD